MIRLIGLAAVAIVSSSCGGNLPQTVRVTGRVTFDGQPPPAPGSIYFLPVEAAEGFPSRPATGDFDAAGRYSAATFERGDGLMPGKYIASVESWASPPNMEGKPVKSHVPVKYQSANTSGLKLDIVKGMRAQEFNIDVVTK